MEFKSVLSSSSLNRYNSHIIKNYLINLIIWKSKTWEFFTSILNTQLCRWNHYFNEVSYPETIPYLHFILSTRRFHYVLSIMLLIYTCFIFSVFGCLFLNNSSNFWLLFILKICRESVKNWQKINFSNMLHFTMFHTISQCGARFWN